MNNGKWTKQDFMFEALLNRNSKVSGRNGNNILDVYNHYRDRNIDIDILCCMGSSIMNFIIDHNIENIESKYLHYAVIWLFENKPVFGLNLHRQKPRFMFCTYLSKEYFKEVYPLFDFKYDRRYDGFVCRKDVEFDEVYDCFFQTVQYFLCN